MAERQRWWKHQNGQHEDVDVTNAYSVRTWKNVKRINVLGMTEKIARTLFTKKSSKLYNKIDNRLYKEIK